MGEGSKTSQFRLKSQNLRMPRNYLRPHLVFFVSHPKFPSNQYKSEKQNIEKPVPCLKISTSVHIILLLIKIINSP